MISDGVAQLAVELIENRRLGHGMNLKSYKMDSSEESKQRPCNKIPPLSSPVLNLAQHIDITTTVGTEHGFSLKLFRTCVTCASTAILKQQLLHRVTKERKKKSCL